MLRHFARKILLCETSRSISTVHLIEDSPTYSPNRLPIGGANTGRQNTEGGTSVYMSTNELYTKAERIARIQTIFCLFFFK